MGAASALLVLAELVRVVACYATVRMRISQPNDSRCCQRLTDPRCLLSLFPHNSCVFVARSIVRSFVCWFVGRSINRSIVCTAAERVAVRRRRCARSRFIIRIF